MTPIKTKAAAGVGTRAALNKHFNQNSNIDALLSRLDGVRQTGAGRWVARCPAHADKTASLSIRELDDGRILLHDFAGCGVHEVTGAVGLTLSDLFPKSIGEHFGPERRPFPAADVLRCIAFEALVVAAAAASLLAGEPVSNTDRDRLMLAVQRIHAGLTAAGVNHG